MTIVGVKFITAIYLYTFLFLCTVLYCLIAPFGTFDTSFDSSHFTQESVLAILIDDSVRLVATLQVLHYCASAGVSVSSKPKFP